MKGIITYIIAFSVTLNLWAQIEEFNPREMPMSEERNFKMEVSPIGAQLDSLMTLHVFRYKKSALPKNYDSTHVPVFADSVIINRLAALDAASPMHFDYNPVVKGYIDMYSMRRREQVSRMLSLGQYYFPMFEKSLDKYKMPLELKYLAVVESALNPLATSRVGAKGLWQFMYETGKLMGLQVNSFVDERSDPYKSTDAACRYMMRLYKTFGDWNLVLAAYNSGPGNVSKAIRRSGGKTNYWELRPFLPKETAGYVPAFIAAVYVMNYAAEHNIYPKVEIPSFFEVDTILVKEQISFEQISRWIGVNLEMVAFLNPMYKLQIIPSVPGHNYYLTLPHKYSGLFLDNEDSLYAFAAEEFKKNKPQSVVAYASTGSGSQSKQVHSVKRGENLGSIARKYNVSVTQIKKNNNLKSDLIMPGQKLVINVGSSSTSVAQTNNREDTYYIVQPGDTLYSIASRYPGVSADALAQWNNVNASSLQPGMKLVVKKASN